jgi:hypothetical protein
VEVILARTEARLDRWRRDVPFRARLAALGVLTLAALAAFFVLPAHPQPLEYHLFANTRTRFGIPNFADVSSNFGFFLVGVAGLWAVARPRPGMFRTRREAIPYAVMFVAITLLFFASAYYHLAPDNERLFWDRLPMVVGFGALISAMVTERIDGRAGMWTLPFAIGIGVATLAYWLHTERIGAGNVMPYAVFQAYTVMVAALILALFPSSYTRGRDMLGAIALYGASKVTETFDAPIFHALGEVVSGHTLKHLLAAAGLGLIVRMLLQRRPRTVRPA